MSGVALVISDVDGTLVTTDKRLTPRTRDAVAALGRAGIAFTLISSRPPFGMGTLVAPLQLRLPFAGFNGGMIVNPDLSPIARHLIGEATSRAAVDLLLAGGVDVWLFTGEAWIARDPQAAYVAHERHTIMTDPTIVESFEPYLAGAAKIVGVSADFDRLAALEGAARRSLAGRANLARGQLYYLDVTPSGFDKGTTVEVLAQRLGVNLAEVVTLGDMENDVPMFRKAGFSVAMGNATEAVKAEAKAVTLSNEEDGFAAAVETLILPRAAA